MAAILHFTWIPKKSTETRPVDKARAIKRGDTFKKTIRFWTDSTKTAPKPLAGTFAAQLRAEEVGPGADPEAPVLATVDVDATDAATGILVLRMTSTVTRDLPEAPGYWDLQQDDSGTITTLMGGKYAVADDVTRDP